jgi:hypothetical protein
MTRMSDGSEDSDGPDIRKPCLASPGPRGHGPARGRAVVWSRTRGPPAAAGGSLAARKLGGSESFTTARGHGRVVTGAWSRVRGHGPALTGPRSRAGPWTRN